MRWGAWTEVEIAGAARALFNFVVLAAEEATNRNMRLCNLGHEDNSTPRLSRRIYTDKQYRTHVHTYTYDLSLHTTYYEYHRITHKPHARKPSVSSLSMPFVRPIKTSRDRRLLATSAGTRPRGSGCSCSTLRAGRGKYACAFARSRAQ